MTKIKTRLEAKKASIKKWDTILTRIEKLQGDVSENCGFCKLAADKAKKKSITVYRCTFCEPDAEKLCRKYITDDRLIVDPLSEAYDQIISLTKNLRLLPDVLKEE